jgi:phosphate starvation-inducible PhoH-like protein
VRRQIELSNEVAAELAGSEDAVLREIERHVDCNVYLRGNVVTLDGSQEAIDAAAEVIKEISELVAGGHQISPGTIDAVTGALDRGT